MRGALMRYTLVIQRVFQRMLTPICVIILHLRNLRGEANKKRPMLSHRPTVYICNSVESLFRKQ